MDRKIKIALIMALTSIIVAIISSYQNNQINNPTQIIHGNSGKIISTEKGDINIEDLH